MTMPIDLTSRDPRGTQPNHFQPEPTDLIWGCGHTASVYLALNPIVASEQIAAYIQIDCLPCAKAKKAQLRNITWADINRSR